MADAQQKSTGIVDTFLRSPLAGLAPWIVMSLLSGPGRFEEAVAAAFGISLVFFLAGMRRRQSIKLLEVFDLVFFGAMCIVGLAASDGTIRWLEDWAGEASNIALAAFAIGSILVRVPFTLQYAKEETPEEYWESPLFVRVNYVLTGVWAAAFAFNAVLGYVGDGILHSPGNFWTAWILQIGALLFAVSFTEWYPEYAPNKAALEAGEPTEPPQSPARLFDWFFPFVIAVGVAGLVADALPDAVAIGLIVVGVVGSGAYRKVFPDDQSK